MGISRAEALDSLRSDDLVGIGMEADAVRRRLHPEGVVSYAVAGQVDCANTDAARVYARARELSARGGSGTELTGLGGLDLPAISRVVREVRRGLAETWISGLSAAELAGLGTAAGGDLASMIGVLTEAGWNSPGEDPADLLAGAEVLDRWFAVHRAAHRAGVRTVAAMRFGAGETIEQRVDFLERVAALQNETGGFVAFAPHTAGGGLHGPTAVECLKTIAVSRLLLDEVSSVEAGRATGSLKVLETMLRFGADDAGQIMVQGSGSPDLREEDLRRVIRDAGFGPAERDPGYRLMFVS